MAWFWKYDLLSFVFDCLNEEEGGGGGKGRQGGGGGGGGGGDRGRSIWGGGGVHFGMPCPLFKITLHIVQGGLFKRRVYLYGLD